MIRRKNGLAVLATILMSIGLMSAVVATAAPANAVAYHEYENGASDLDDWCLEGRANKDVYRAPCDGQWHQQWQWIDRADGVSLKNRLHGNCLAIDDGKVVLRDCVASFVSQRWERSGFGGWRNLHSNKCIEAFSDITRILQDDCNASFGGQYWDEV